MINDVVILIPFHNSVHWIRPCLFAIKQAKFPLKNILIVNDRSSRANLEICKKIINEFGGDIRLASNSGRPGFGGAVNFGVSMLKCKYVLLLNSDCLITESTVGALVAPLIESNDIFMSCPISNNSPNYSFQIPEGMNYLSVAKYLNEIYAESTNKPYVEAATVVGNCLMVKRSVFDELGGFSDEWGVGYGEETDLQFRAAKLGYESVLALNTFVYHYGGGTFKTIVDIQAHKDQNYQLFIKKWGREYKNLLSKQKFNPITLLNFLFQNFKKENSLYDVIFYLPTIDQQIGGIHSIVDICNMLISNGINATCALIGGNSNALIEGYKEPIYFNPLYYINEGEFLEHSKNLNFKLIVSTVHTSAEVCSKIKKVRTKHFQYIQGIEYMFETGGAFKNTIESYEYGDGYIFASRFLQKRLNNFVKKDSSKYAINPYINRDIFYPDSEKKKYFLGMCLRKVEDKGQGYLINLLLNKRMSCKKILVFGDGKYSFIGNYKNIHYIELPVSREVLANYLRTVENYIDLSIHEGYGLMGMEAILCGAKLFYTNYGGLEDYLHIENHFLISNPLDSDLIIDKIIKSKNSNKINKIKNQKSSLGWIDIINEYTV